MSAVPADVTRYIRKGSQSEENLAAMRRSSRGSGLTEVNGVWIFWSAKKWRPWIYARDRSCCCWCGKVVLPGAWRGHPDRASLDHLRPTSRGGSHGPFNLVTSCGLCNEKRFNMDWRVWAQFLGREAELKDAVADVQYRTYTAMAAGEAGPLFALYALELYRQGLHPVWGATIDPDPAVYREFVFKDTGIWGVLVVPNSPWKKKDPNHVPKNRIRVMRSRGVLY